MAIKLVKPKPIYRRRIVALPIMRIPDQGFLAPRLQPPEVVIHKDAIGFMQNASDDE